jgi:hypothetical protein
VPFHVGVDDQPDPTHRPPMPKKKKGEVGEPDPRADGRIGAAAAAAVTAAEREAGEQ